jgi:NitT/TauT family transport system ATP-binding protein
VWPSGCGKSTLLRMIAGLDRATKGTVTVDSRRVTAPLPGIGIVFQRDLLLDWRTVLDNVLLPSEFQRMNRRDAEGRARELLAELGVADFADRHPWELSGGMRQRVSIARALLCKPAMLFLDEPFSALDALTRDQMNVVLQKVQLAERVTTLLITHSILEAVFLSDRVIVMSARPGRILDEIPVPFLHPRRLAIREDPAFVEIARRIRLHFERTGVLVG